MTFEELPDVLTLKETAQYLKISYAKIHEMVHANEIPHFRIGRAIRVNKHVLKNWLDEKTEPKH